MTAGGATASLQAVPARHSGAVAAALATAGLGMTVIGLAVSEHGIELAPGLPTWLAVAGFAGLVAMAVAAWIVLADRPRVATGLSMAMLALALPSWTAWNWVPVQILPFLHAAAPMAVAGAAHISIGWPLRTGPPYALIAVYALALVTVALMAVGYDSLGDPACAFTCADTEPVAGSLVTTRAAVTTTAVVLTAAALITGWALAGDQRAPLTLRLSAFVGIGLLVAGWDLRAAWWTDSVPPVVAVALPVAAAWVLSAGALITWWVARRNRIAAERLVAELNKTQAAGTAMHGGRAVEFAIPGEARWVDSNGRTVQGHDAPNGAVALRLGGDIAVRVRPGPGAMVPALEAISPSARVALDIARLTAVTKARVRDVQDSQRRIISASDAERWRIARDLHDGAQQRLISASLHISVAERNIPDPHLERAQTAIREALEQLRRLAHGLVPETLRSDGIGAALEDLVRESDVPAALEMADVVVEDDVAAAIHAAVSALLMHAGTVGARDVRVDVARLSEERIALQIEVRGPRRLDAWDDIRVVDRIGAVGGTTTVHAIPTRLELRAELPCVS